MRMGWPSRGRRDLSRRQPDRRPRQLRHHPTGLAGQRTRSGLGRPWPRPFLIRGAHGLRPPVKRHRGEPGRRFVYAKAGSRTDHGEVPTSGGRYPGLRETPLTARIFRLPATGTASSCRKRRGATAERRLRLRNRGEEQLRPDLQRGVRALLGTTPADRDDNDELTGFAEGGPLRLSLAQGTNDKPQQFPGYDPEADRIVNHTFYANRTLLPRRPDVSTASVRGPHRPLRPRSRLRTASATRRRARCGRRARRRGRSERSRPRSPSAFRSERERAGGSATAAAPSSSGGRGRSNGSIPRKVRFGLEPGLLYLDLQRRRSVTPFGSDLVCGFPEPDRHGDPERPAVLLEFGGRNGVGDHDPAAEP